MCSLGTPKTGCTNPNTCKTFPKNKKQQSEMDRIELLQEDEFRQTWGRKDRNPVLWKTVSKGRRRQPGNGIGRRSHQDWWVPSLALPASGRWVNKWGLSPLSPKGGLERGFESPDFLRAVLIGGDCLMCSECVYLSCPAFMVCPTIRFQYKLGLEFYKSRE